MRRSLIVLLAALLSPESRAANLTFDVIPANPIAGRPYQIRITRPFEPCGTPLPAVLDATDLGGGVIRYAIPGSDACENDLPAQQVTYDASPLPAGNYTFRFAFCGLFPIDCQTIEERAVAVVAAPAAATIPTLSKRAALVCAVLVLLLGWARPRGLSSRTHP